MVDITRGVVVKLCPSAEQIIEFNKNFGACRKVYNTILAKHIAEYGENPDKLPSRTKMNTYLKETKKEYPYLQNVESTSLQQARDDLYKAFVNYFKSKIHKHPIFHSKKKTRLSFRQTIRKEKTPVKGNKVTLRVYGDIEFRTSTEYKKLLNDPQIKFNSITVYSDGLNYYAVFNIETQPPKHLSLTDKHIGCDINSNKNGWLVTSDKQKEFFDVSHENQVIRHINKLMSKCRKKSRRWRKLHKKLQKSYIRRTNILKDYIEKLSYNLVKEYDTIVFEKNYAAIKILIAGEQNMIFPLSLFIKRLKDKFKLYKPDADGVQFVDAKNTSKTCHHCGAINEELEVQTCNWICPACKKQLDRDVNSSINILNRWFNGVCSE